MKSFIALAVLLVSAVTAQHAPLGMRAHRRNFNPALERREEMIHRRAPQDDDGPGLTLFPDPPVTTSQTTSTSSTVPPPSPPPVTTTTTTPPPQNPDPPTTTTTTTTSSTTTTSDTTTSTTSTTSATSTPTTSNTRAATGTVLRTSTDTYTGISFATARTSNLRASTASSSTEETAAPDGGGDFASNKAAVAATATVAALVALGALVFIAFWWKKKSKRDDLAEDMWDGASMKEFSDPTFGAGASIVTPPPAARNIDLESEMGGGPAGALARSGTKVLPSQAALARSRSARQQQHDNAYEEEPDVLLAMPPVAHYERPRDSAYDIVPAAPPVAGGYGGQGGYGYSNAYASGSSSGGLQPPARKGDHTSFGSGIGHDPFAGTGFVDASRESSFGAGQAGRGAGYAAGAQGQDQGQWAAQQYNPYTGYSQSPQGYGNGYGYAS